MLQSLRSSVASLVIKVFAFLLAASFVVWGFSDTYIFGQVGNTVAEVGKREITVATLQQAFRREVDRLRQYNIDEKKAREMGLLDQTLNRLVTTALLDSAADDIGMLVGTASIQAAIRKQFDGDIDPAKLENILRNNGLTEAQFVSQLRGQMIRTEYVESLTGPVRAPNQLAERLYRWREEKRAADWFAIPVDPNSPVKAPTATEIEEHYKVNQAAYRAPEYRSARFTFLDPALLVKDITVSKEKLEAAYKDRLASLSVPERRNVLQMLVPDEATAAKAKTRLGAGEDFLGVAKDLAGQDESATRLGTVTKADLPEEIAETVFKLAKGAVSDPIKGPFGLQIMKVTGITPGMTPSLDDVRKPLTKELGEEQAIETVFDQSNRLEELIGGGAPLEEAARELGLAIRKLDGISEEGRDKNDKPVANIPSEPFLKTLFETAKGEDSLLTEGENNTFFIVHVDSVEPAKVRPLDSIRDQVRADWMQEQRWKAARDKAKAFVAQLNTGGKIADIAKKAGFKLRSSGSFNRVGEGLKGGMSPALVTDLFDVPAVGRAATADGRAAVHVAQLKEISEVKAGGDRTGVEAVAKTLRAGIAGDIARQLDNALRKRHDVSIDQRVIKYNFYRDAGES